MRIPMRCGTSDTEPPQRPGPMFYRILQIKLFPFLQNFRSMHALPRVTAEQRVVQLSSEVNMKMTLYIIMMNMKLNITIVQEILSCQSISFGVRNWNGYLNCQLVETQYDGDWDPELGHRRVGAIHNLLFYYTISFPLFQATSLIVSYWFHRVQCVQLK